MGVLAVFVLFGMFVYAAARLVLMTRSTPPTRDTTPAIPVAPPRPTPPVFVTPLTPVQRRVREIETKLACSNQLMQAFDRNHAHRMAELAGVRPGSPEHSLYMAQLRYGVPRPVRSDVGVRPSSDAAMSIPTPVHFKATEPQRLDQYVGQSQLVQRLLLHMRALDPEDVVLPHLLLTGLPGFGKTLLAKLIAQELWQRARQHGHTLQFVDTYAANLNTAQDLDAIVQRIHTGGPTVWFIDELHVIDALLATKLYLLMEEQRYPFHGDLTPTPLPPVMVIGATTDYGRLHPALKRRFGEALMLQPLTSTDLATLTRSVLTQADPSAVERVVQRTKYSGAPHEVMTLARDIQVYAKAHGLAQVTADTVEAVCALWDIDERGLRPIDRTMLQTLARRPRKRHGETVYGAAEADLCALAGVDVGEFQRVIRPRLMARGYLEIRPGLGVALTARALQDYPAAV